MNIANFIGREGFNWWIGQVENDGAKFWNAELEDGNGDFDYGDWDWTCLLYTSPSPRDRG